MLVEKKCYESNFKVSSGNVFYEKSRRGVGEKKLSFPVEFVGKILPLPPKNMGPTTPLSVMIRVKDIDHLPRMGHSRKDPYPPTEEIENNPLPPFGNP